MRWSVQDLPQFDAHDQSAIRSKDQFNRPVPHATVEGKVLAKPPIAVSEPLYQPKPFELHTATLSFLLYIKV
jgi:hypothetical protein